MVLCGGSARIPKLQQLIKDLFPTVELLNSIPPDEVIPIGAAIEAGILLGRDCLFLEDELLSVECSAKDISVKVRLKHRSQTQGPRAECGPPRHFMWPLRTLHFPRSKPLDYNGTYLRVIMHKIGFWPSGNTNNANFGPLYKMSLTPLV